ncbi:hypothetical protein Btru_047411 [Bulinus truncatus]|nr:hypothetical protein Btru_047411 [Bulinus truncatus]
MTSIFGELSLNVKNFQFEVSHQFCAIGFKQDEQHSMSYVSDESLHSVQSVAQEDIRVDELRKMWKLPAPKLFVWIIGEIDESIGHKTLFDIKECLEDLVEFLVQKDCWLLIEIPNFQYFKYLESFLEKTTISAGACIPPVIGLYTGLESFVLDRGSGGIADVIGDCIERGRKHSIEEKRSLMKRLEHLLKEIDKPFQVLYINGKLQDSNIAEGILTAIKDAIEGLTTEPDKSLLIGNKKYLMLCLHLNQLNIAAEFGALWKVVKMKLPYCQDIFKEAVQLERYDFVQYMMSQGLELNTVIQANIFSVSPIAAALFAYGMLKAMVKCETDDDEIIVIKEHMLEYQKYAIETVNITYTKTRESTLKLLGQPMITWGNTTCILLALRTGNRKFLSQAPCRKYRHTVWTTGSSSPRNGSQQKTGNNIATNPINNFPFQQNLFDSIEILSAALFILAWLARLNGLVRADHTFWTPIARVLFSIDFCIFCMCPLELCYVSEFLGPLIIMVGRMLKLLMKFLLLVFVLCFAYAISSESVLRCNEDFNWTPPFYFFRRTIWAMFGEFLMDEFKKDNINSDQPECISELGSYFASPLLAIFFIIVNILMFNLLIALFNSKIKAVEERSREFWHHQFMLLSMKYCKTVFLPPPFTVLFPLLIYCNAGGEKGIFNQKEILPAELTNLQRLEASGRFKFIQETEDRHISVVCNGIIKCPHKEETKLLRTVTQQTEQDEVTVSKKPKSPQHSEKKDVGLFVRPSHIISDNRPSSTTNAVTPSSNINAKKSYVTQTQDISTNISAVSDSGDLFNTDYYY